MTPLALSFCGRLAVAKPIPLFPQVATVTFPLSLFMQSPYDMSSFLGGALGLKWQGDHRTIWTRVLSRFLAEGV
jgi:hypothetical protein